MKEKRQKKGRKNETKLVKKEEEHPEIVAQRLKTKKTGKPKTMNKKKAERNKKKNIIMIYLVLIFAKEFHLGSIKM